MVYEICILISYATNLKSGVSISCTNFIVHDYNVLIDSKSWKEIAIGSNRDL